MKPEPFRIEIEQAVLDDLRSRIRATRWPDAIPGVGWDHGTDPDFLRRALEYWAEEFDWRAREDELNRHAHFRHVMYPHQVRARENARGYGRRGGEARQLVGLLREE